VKEKIIRISSATELNQELIDEIIIKKGIWFICPFCDKGVYETKGHLMNHLKWKHAEILEKLGAA